jgi:benzodiazapine receptor
MVGFVGDQGANLGFATWYPMISKPGWSCPVWVFTLVWTISYGLMGVCLRLILRSEDRTKGAALATFGIQLVLSGLWPWLFFAGHWLLFSSAGALALWLAVAITALLVVRVTKAGALFLVVYLLWVSYTAALSISIWRMNPDGGRVQVVTCTTQKNDLLNLAMDSART